MDYLLAALFAETMAGDRLKEFWSRDDSLGVRVRCVYLRMDNPHK